LHESCSCLCDGCGSFETAISNINWDSVAKTCRAAVYSTFHVLIVLTESIVEELTMVTHLFHFSSPPWPNFCEAVTTSYFDGTIRLKAKKDHWSRCGRTCASVQSINTCIFYQETLLLRSVRQLYWSSLQCLPVHKIHSPMQRRFSNRLLPHNIKKIPTPLIGGATLPKLLYCNIGITSEP
jgi:hypothetical protein